jgi:hypothetical protein
MKDLITIRTKLLTYTGAITLYLNLLSLGSLGKVEKHMSSYGADIKRLQHSVNWLIVSKQESIVEGLVFTNYKDDNKKFWRELRRDLVNEGYSSSVLQEHKKLIKDYIAKLGNKGVLDNVELLENPELLYNTGSLDDLEVTADIDSTDDSQPLEKQKSGDVCRPANEYEPVAEQRQKLESTIDNNILSDIRSEDGIESEFVDSDSDPDILLVNRR